MAVMGIRPLHMYRRAGIRREEHMFPPDILCQPEIPTQLNPTVHHVRWLWQDLPALQV